MQKTLCSQGNISYICIIKRIAGKDYGATSYTE